VVSDGLRATVRTTVNRNLAWYLLDIMLNNDISYDAQNNLHDHKVENKI